jgi:Peptidase_C39 like family
MHRSKLAALLLITVSFTAACATRWNAGDPALVLSAPPPSAVGLPGLASTAIEREGAPAMGIVDSEAEVAIAAEAASLHLEARLGEVASSREALSLEPQVAARAQVTAGIASTERVTEEPVVAEIAAASPSAELVIAQVPVPMSPPASAAEPAVATAAIRMPIPFRTQKDGDRFQGSNCGPAALGMVLDGFGVARGNADLRFLAHTYQGTVGARTGTALQHIAQVAADLGLEPRGLYQTPDKSWGKEGFARWTVEDVRAEVLTGRPVIPLVKFRLLPGHEDSPFRADHYVVIHGVDGDSFLYHDPIYESPWEGGARWMSAETLAAAMRPTLVPQQAVSFASGRFAALPTVGR